MFLLPCTLTGTCQNSTHEVALNEINQSHIVLLSKDCVKGLNNQISDFVYQQL